MQSQQQPQSPWLQLAANLNQQLQQQPEETQQAVKAISKPIYPNR